MPRAIDPRGVMELLGHREKELTQEEDREDAHEEGDDLRRICVVPPEVAATHEHEVGDDRRLRRDEESREEQREEDASTAEAHASEGVAGKDGRSELADRRQRRDENRVRESVRPERVRVLPGLDPVLGMPRGRPEQRRTLRRLAEFFEGGRDHPVEGEGRDRRTEDQERVFREAADDICSVKRPRR